VTDHLNWAREKYGDAVEALATGPGDVRSRLRYVFDQYLVIEPEMVPDEDGVRDDIRWIHAQLARWPATEWQSAAHRTLDRIRNSTGSKIADRVVTVRAKLDEIARRRREEPV
jgi:hypothetical protein